MVTKSVSVDDIVLALRTLGSEARVAEIKNEVQRQYGGVPSNYASEYTFRNTIQKLIEDHSPQSANYRPHRQRLFERIAFGVYRLTAPLSILDDLKNIEEDVELDATTRQKLIDARLGQGKFRKDLIEFWSSCAVTGVNVMQVLRASHIKPWYASTNEERLDPYNGLLLCANIDALFDAGLISFADSGFMVFSNQIDSGQLRSLSLKSELRLSRLSGRHKAYLAFHREHYLDVA